MSQIGGLTNGQTAYLFADSNISDGGAGSIGLQRKLFGGHRFIAATAGLTIGIRIVEGLVERGRPLGIETIDALTEYLLYQGNAQYRQFVETFHDVLNEELLRLYLLIAAPNGDGGVAMRLIGAEGGDNLHTVPTGSVITAPRRPLYEMALQKSIGYPQDGVLGAITGVLAKIAARDDTVRPPFHAGIIDATGNFSLHTLPS